MFCSKGGIAKTSFSACTRTGPFGVSARTYALLLNAAAGRNEDENFFERLGERVWCQTRLFNFREGITAEMDTLPKRFVKEALSNGPHKGQRIGDAAMKRMLGDYYRLRGWDERGRPKDETLERLGLSNQRRFTI